MSNLMTVATHRIARLVRHPEPSAPAQPVTFIGVATLRTSRPDLRGPYARPVSADLLIYARGGVTMTALYVVPVKLGSVTCTITRLPRTGIGTYVDGDLRLTLGLYLGIDVLKGAEDSEIMLTLTTDSPSSRTNADGQLTLTGTATFQHGYIGGRLANVVVNGRISPVAEVRPRSSVA